MDNYSYKTVDFEGGDQVGKGDAVIDFSDKISQLGYDSCVISFPYYATPIGYIIRTILTNGFPTDLELSLEREIDIKMLLFALNRLEILNCILSDKQFDIYIFDRGPFSNALTIGYHVFQNPKKDSQKKRLALKAIGFDSFFRETLNIDNGVICLRHKDISWEKSRGDDKGDLHERKEVQEISKEVYDILENEIGDGWRNVVTKDKDGWRSRDDICKDCIDFVLERGLIKKKKSKKAGNLHYLGINEIQKFLYHGSEVEDTLKTDWLNCLKENNKKEVYRVSELVSNALVATTELLVWKDVTIKGFVSSLLSNYPEIFDIIEYQYGKSFRDKFKKSLQ